MRVSEPATLLPFPPGKAELRDRGEALQPALCWLPLTREREITMLAGTPRQAVPAQLASPTRHPQEKAGMLPAPQLCRAAPKRAWGFPWCDTTLAERALELRTLLLEGHPWLPETAGGDLELCFLVHQS